MLKLITQFDNEKMTAGVAIPRGGGSCSSCSCSCCVVTMLASSYITGSQFGASLDIQHLKGEFSISEDEFRSKKNLARILGFLLLPLTLGATFAMFAAALAMELTDIGVFVFFAFPLLFASGLFILAKKFKFSFWISIAIFFLTLIGFVVEAVVWIYLFLSGSLRIFM